MAKRSKQNITKQDIEKMFKSIGEQLFNSLPLIEFLNWTDGPSCLAYYAPPESFVGLFMRMYCHKSKEERKKARRNILRFYGGEEGLEIYKDGMLEKLADEIEGVR